MAGYFQLTLPLASCLIELSCLRAHILISQLPAVGETMAKDEKHRLLFIRKKNCYYHFYQPYKFFYDLDSCKKILENCCYEKLSESKYFPLFHNKKYCLDPFSSQITY